MPEMEIGSEQVLVARDGDVLVVTINRPEVLNAIDGPTAAALAATFRDFDADPGLAVAVLTGAGRAFCSGADLSTVAGADTSRILALTEDGDGPLGVSRMLLTKPVIAAVEGHAVAGGLELSLWCDLRVASETAVFGVFCRRWGVPLIDGGTIRLPRLVGHGRALDMILTGREVGAAEALQIGLANRVVPAGEAVAAAVEMAHQLAALPQACLRSDRQSAYQQWGLEMPAALRNEFQHGLGTIQSGETQAGAKTFVERQAERKAPAK